MSLFLKRVFCTEQEERRRPQTRQKDWLIQPSKGVRSYSAVPHFLTLLIVRNVLCLAHSLADSLCFGPQKRICSSFPIPSSLRSHPENASVHDGPRQRTTSFCLVTTPFPKVQNRLKQVYRDRRQDFAQEMEGK